MPTNCRTADECPARSPAATGLDFRAQKSALSWLAGRPNKPFSYRVFQPWRLGFLCSTVLPRSVLVVWP